MADKTDLSSTTNAIMSKDSTELDLTKIKVSQFDKGPDRLTDKRATQIPRIAASKSPLATSTMTSTIQPAAAIAVATKIPQLKKSPRPGVPVQMSLAIG